MEMIRIPQPNDDNTPFNSEEFEAGYLARLSGEPQCISATRGWRAGWSDADASFSGAGILRAS